MPIRTIANLQNLNCWNHSNSVHIDEYLNLKSIIKLNALLVAYIQLCLRINFLLQLHMQFLDSHPSSFLMFIYMYAVTQTFIEQVIANMAQYIFFYNFRQFIEARICLI